MTSEERREALAEHISPGCLGEVVELVESWLAEKDAEIEGLSTSDWNGWADAINRARGDERRRTAEEIKRRIGDERDHPRRTTSLDGRAAALNDARLICDEVGGSDDQQ